MKKYLQVCSVILLFLLMSSCEGQNQTDTSQTRESSHIPIERITTPDVDPYFMESKAIASPYGPTDITRNVLEDSKGNIWLATWEGIIDFDFFAINNLLLNKAYHRITATGIPLSKSPVIVGVCACAV